MTDSTTKKLSDAYAADQKAAWLSFYRTKHTQLKAWGDLSLTISPLFLFIGLLFAPPLIIIAIGLVIFSAISHIEFVPHAPKDALALTMPNEALISLRLPPTFQAHPQPQRQNELYTGHRHARGYHAYDACDQSTKLRGDELKGKILSDFAAALDACTDLKTLQDTVSKQINSAQYCILATGQGITTQFFGLETTSQRKYEEMCHTKASAFYASAAVSSQRV